MACAPFFRAPAPCVRHLIRSVHFSIPGPAKIDILAHLKTGRRILSMRAANLRGRSCSEKGKLKQIAERVSCLSQEATTPYR